MTTAISKQLDYKTLILDFFGNNVRLQRMVQKLGPVIGIIPRAAYVIGSDWQDLVIVYNDLTINTQLTFDRLISQNRLDRCAATDNDKPAAKL
jgi:hypothetical protein